jgi:nucleoid-associated protein YgaU
MTILNGSRYYGQPVLSIPIASGYQATNTTGAAVTRVPTVFGPPPPMTNSFIFYTVREGDRLDNIAGKVFGVPDYWWKIAQANPEVFYPEVLVPGSIIRIPTA